MYPDRPDHQDKHINKYKEESNEDDSVDTNPANLRSSLVIDSLKENNLKRFTTYNLPGCARSNSTSSNLRASLRNQQVISNDLPHIINPKARKLEIGDHLWTMPITKVISNDLLHII